jgi:hypothetical protein
MTNSVKLPALAATLAVIAATLSGIDCTPAPGRVWRTATPVTNAAFSNVESMRQQFPKLPITFEENRGQTDKDVRYFAQGPHYAFFLTQNEVRLSLARASNKGIVLGLRFLGLNPSATVIGAVVNECFVSSYILDTSTHCPLLCSGNQRTRRFLPSDKWGR